MDLPKLVAKSMKHTEKMINRERKKKGKKPIKYVDNYSRLAQLMIKDHKRIRESKYFKKALAELRESGIPLLDDLSAEMKNMPSAVIAQKKAGAGKVSDKQLAEMRALMVKQQKKKLTKLVVSHGEKGAKVRKKASILNKKFRLRSIVQKANRNIFLILSQRYRKVMAKGDVVPGK